MKMNITTDPTYTKSIINTYEQLLAYQLGNLEEMDEFLERHKISKLTQEEMNNWNSQGLLKKMNL